MNNVRQLQTKIFYKVLHKAFDTKVDKTHADNN